MKELEKKEEPISYQDIFKFIKDYAKSELSHSNIAICQDAELSEKENLDMTLFLLVLHNQFNLLEKLLKKYPKAISYLSLINPKNTVPNYYRCNDLIKIAITHQKIDIINLLEKYAWNINFSHFQTAVENNAYSSLQYLLAEHKLEPDKMDSLAVTACEKGQLNLLILLKPDQPLFFFQNILLELKDGKSVKIHEHILLAYRNSNLSLSNKLIKHFLNKVKTDFPEKYEDISLIVEAAKKHYFETAPFFVRFFPLNYQVELWNSYLGDKWFILEYKDEKFNKEILDKDFSSFIPMLIHHQNNLYFYGRDILGNTQIRKMKLKKEFQDKIKFSETPSGPFSINTIHPNLKNQVRDYRLHICLRTDIESLRGDFEIGLRHSNLVNELLSNISSKKTFEPWDIKASQYKQFQVPKSCQNQSHPTMRSILMFLANDREQEAKSRDNLGFFSEMAAQIIRSPRERTHTSLANNRYTSMTSLVKKMNDLSQYYGKDETLMPCKTGYKILYKNRVINYVSFTEEDGWDWQHGVGDFKSIWPDIETNNQQLFSFNKENIQKNPQPFLDKLVEQEWLMGNLTPLVRGTGTVNQMLLAMFFRLYGFDVPILKPNLQLDCLNLTFSLKIYQKIFLYFFEIESLSPALRKYHEEMHWKDPERRLLAKHFGFGDDVPKPTPSHQSNGVMDYLSQIIFTSKSISESKDEKKPGESSKFSGFLDSHLSGPQFFP